jgi:hypothetical protein
MATCMACSVHALNFAAARGSGHREAITIQRPKKRATTVGQQQVCVVLSPVLRSMPRSSGPWPTLMPRRNLSLMSTTRRHMTASGSMSSRTKRDTCAHKQRLQHQKRS